LKVTCQRSATALCNRQGGPPEPHQPPPFKNTGCRADSVHLSACCAIPQFCAPSHLPTSLGSLVSTACPCSTTLKLTRRGLGNCEFPWSYTSLLSLFVWYSHILNWLSGRNSPLTLSAFTARETPLRGIKTARTCSPTSTTCSIRFCTAPDGQL
jgi:hypothetical protein